MSVCCPEHLDVSHIVELVAIFRPLGINHSLAISFVAKVASLILQIVLDLLFNRQIKHLLTNSEEIVGILE